MTALVSDYDLVVNAVPGFMGFDSAQAIIKAGKDYACIAFYAEYPFELPVEINLPGGCIFSHSAGSESFLEDRHVI